MVYDESEQFRQYHDELFQYPFEPRKSIVGKDEIKLNPEGHHIFTIGFSLSDVCLEGHYMNQFFKIIRDSQEMIQEYLGIESEEDEGEDYL